MFIKILSKINREDNFYYVNVVSPFSNITHIASSDFQLDEGQTYRATPHVHWIRESEEDTSLAHFRVVGKQISMERLF